MDLTKLTNEELKNLAESVNDSTPEDELDAILIEVIKRTKNRNITAA